MKSRSIDHLGNYKPEDSFLRNGSTISITGPNVNYEDVLLKLIKKSTGQAVKEKPFILAISMNNMVGNWANNIQAIQSSFQPNKNTRFTGVLLIEYFVRIPADPDGDSGSIRTLNRKHPDTLSSDLILR
jgi:hypothetical protein